MRKTKSALTTEEDTIETRAEQSKEKPGKINIVELRKNINKQAGIPVAFNLNEENPSEVTEFISTGCFVLDCILVRGKVSGLGLSRCYEIAGTFSSGKSFMGALLCANAQKLDPPMIPVYFDSESAIDPDFLARCGCDLEQMIYVQATNLEFVFETMENLLKQGNRYLFVLDSMAQTPTRTLLEGGYDPQATMAVKPRVASLGLSKLTQPIANSRSVFVILNQLKTNIPKNPIDALLNPYFAPSGAAVGYVSSARIWLTPRKGKASYIRDENGYICGTEVSVKLEKSRFGTQYRTISFKILWGDEHPRFDETDIWYEIASRNENIKGPVGKAHGELTFEDGTTETFSKGNWAERLREPKFYNRIKELVKIELVDKFANKTGSAANFYEELPAPAESEELN